MTHSIPYLNATTVSSLVAAQTRTGSEFPMDGDGRLVGERRLRVQTALYNREKLHFDVANLANKMSL